MNRRKSPRSAIFSRRTRPAYITGQNIVIDGGLTAGWTEYALVPPANVQEGRWIDDALKHSCSPALVKIPSGAFVMGETADDKFATDTERPAHRVAIARAFALGYFPVTVGEYRAFPPRTLPVKIRVCPPSM